MTMRGRVAAMVVWFGGLALVAGCHKGEWQLGNPTPSRLPSGEIGLAPMDIPDIPPPRRLRPCCAFGTALKVKVGDVPVPGYDVGNIVAADQLGHHNYDQGMLPTSVDERGVFRSERNGLLYTCRGGFIDTAHIRDNADRTLYLAAQIGRRRQEGGTIDLPDEGGTRRVVLAPFPLALRREFGDREVTVRIAEWLAFYVSVWHEIATWYGWSTSPLFPETASAFSPEDLYSNLLGIRTAGDLIRKLGPPTEAQYNEHMDAATQATLAALQPLTPEYTERAFKLIDGVWWDSQRVLPEKNLVLRRNFDVGRQIVPWRVDRFMTTPERRRVQDELCGGAEPATKLSLPHKIGSVEIRSLARLEIRPDPAIAPRFPFPDPKRAWVTPDDFPAIIARIRRDNLHEVGPGRDEP